MITLAFLPLYALADRAWGMDRPRWWPEKGPWKAVVLAALVGGGYLAAGVLGAFLPLAWAVWRTPGWKDVPGASMTPRSAREVAMTFIRHAIAAPPFMALVYWTGGDWQRAGYAMACFAAFATVLGVWLASVKTGDAKPENRILELARGAAYGAAVWWTITGVST
jgi:hypothetical protein